MDYLEGTLSESREKEVADAIDNSDEIQDRVQAIIDIGDMMLFHDICTLKIAKREPQLMDFSQGTNGSVGTEHHFYRRAAETMNSTVKPEMQKEGTEKGSFLAKTVGVLISAILICILVALVIWILYIVGDALLDEIMPDIHINIPSVPARY